MANKNMRYFKISFGLIYLMWLFSFWGIYNNMALLKDLQDGYRMKKIDMNIHGHSLESKKILNNYREEINETYAIIEANKIFSFIICPVLFFVMIGLTYKKKVLFKKEERIGIKL
jgi:uncharacterized membrane protein SpoIIM required for sporulation